MNWVLRTGRYVGAADVEDDAVSFAEWFAALTATFENQFNKSDRLTAPIREKLSMVVPDAY